MIFETKEGDITRASEPYIVFTVNEERYLDAGLALAMLFQFPELVTRFPVGKPISSGWHLIPSKELGGKTILALQCHSLKKPWDNGFAVEQIGLLEEFLLTELGEDTSDEEELFLVEHLATTKFAIPRIGMGMIERALGADWSAMRKAFEESPLQFVLYIR